MRVPDFSVPLERLAEPVRCPSRAYTSPRLSWGLDCFFFQQGYRLHDAPPGMLKHNRFSFTFIIKTKKTIKSDSGFWWQDNIKTCIINTG